MSLSAIPSLSPDPGGSEGFLTLEEASALLRVDVETVRRAIHRGEIPAIRIGRVFRVRREDVLAPYEPAARGER